jgi:two-component system OmpR family response regulator
LVLDVLLGDLAGFVVARRLVAEGRHPPVLFLTARDTTDDKVQGLRIGGDDYVTKPFSLEELVARVEALLRRTVDLRRGSRLTFADIELDDDTHEVWRARPTSS